MTELAIAYEESPTADRAVRVAAALFPAAAARVLHAWPGSLLAAHRAMGRLALTDAVLVAAAAAHDAEAEEDARAVAQRGAAVALAAGLRADGVACAGASTWRALLDAATGADVLVCGTRGRDAGPGAALGSSAVALVHHATGPVLVVPDEDAGTDGPIVIGYDGSSHARAAIACVGRLWPARAAIVVHVWRSPVRRSLAGAALLAIPNGELHETVSDLDEIFAGVAADLAEEGAAAATAAGLQATSATAEDGRSAWHALADTADARGASVVAVGSRGVGGVRRALLGSVSSGLAHGARRPVLVVPDPAS
jgi:nucleotide-binding universal stress UspA family protein